MLNVILEGNAGWIEVEGDDHKTFTATDGLPNPTW